MGQNTNVISIVDRLAERLLSEIERPAVVVRPQPDESVDDFIERLGAAIADLLSDDADLRLVPEPPA